MLSGKKKGGGDRTYNEFSADAICGVNADEWRCQGGKGTDDSQYTLRAAAADAVGWAGT